MSTQESQKRGVRSEAQKDARARDGYNPIPPAKPVEGAFGEHAPDSHSDEDVSLELTRECNERTAQLRIIEHAPPACLEWKGVINGRCLE